VADFIYLDGEIVPAAEARVSALDRGLLYGDGLFETMRFERERVHLRERHLRRLRSSAAMIEIEPPNDDELRGALRLTIEANERDHGILRLTLTRGISSGGLAGNPERPTLLVSQRPLLQTQNSPAAATLVALSTPLRAPETPIRLKSLSHLGYVLAAREVARRGADEGVMMTADGFVAEGSLSNIFMIRNGELWTAPLELGVLPGIARGRILELARELRIATREESFTIEALRGADECFFTNAARGVVPVSSLDGAAFRGAATITMRLRERYAREIADESI
jgi:branched-subunit amino acid aminotransferase/4-amino-4-deoxychorismate lyase